MVYIIAFLLVKMSFSLKIDDIKSLVKLFSCNFIVGITVVYLFYLKKIYFLMNLH